MDQPTSDKAVIDLAISADDFGELERVSGERMLRYFRFAHLPSRLQEISSRFAKLAAFLVENVASGPERTVAFRKLLEAKDCAVRAHLEAVTP